MRAPRGRPGAAWCRVPGADTFDATVNVSGRSRTSGSFVDEVEGVLATSGFPAEPLKLKLTTSTVLHDPAVARQRLDALKALGVRLPIGDFGTGYSARSYLRQFSINIPTIDRSFVDPILHGRLPAGPDQPRTLALDSRTVRTVRGVDHAGHERVREGTPGDERRGEPSLPD